MTFSTQSYNNSYGVHVAMDLSCQKHLAKRDLTLTLLGCSLIQFFQTCINMFERNFKCTILLLCQKVIPLIVPKVQVEVIRKDISNASKSSHYIQKSLETLSQTRCLGRQLQIDQMVHRLRAMGMTLTQNNNEETEGQVSSTHSFKAKQGCEFF